MKLKVALAHDYLIKNGGAERVLEALHELFPSAPVYTLVYDEIGTGGRFKNWEIHTSYLQNRLLIRKGFDYWRFSMPQAVESFDLSQYDLVISDSSSFIKGVITQPKCLHLCYMHTATRFLWFDIKKHIDRGRFLSLTKTAIPFVLHSLRQWDWLAAQRPDVIISNSKTTQKRVDKFYRRQSKVIYPPVDTRRFTDNERKPGDYYLIVSRLEAHKEIDLAIAASNKSNQPLHIVGSGKQEKRLRELAGPQVKFLGHLNDDEVAKEMSLAKAFLSPQVEDFGITMVEALASGCPIIANGSGGATEIVDSKTGILIEKMTVDNLVKELNDFRGEDFTAKLCKERAENFSKDNFLTIMQNELNQLINNKLKE